MSQDSSWLLITALFACLSGGVAWLILDGGYQRRLAHLQQRVSEKLQEQRRTYAALTMQVATLRGRLTDFDAARRRLVESNQQLTTELEARSDELRAAVADARTHKDELARAQAQRGELSTRGAERDASRVQALQSELTAKAQELAAAIERGAEAQRRAEHASTEARELAAHSNELEQRLTARVSELEASVERQAAELREREGTCVALRAELADGATKIDSLSLRCDELEQELQRQSAQTRVALGRAVELEEALVKRDEQLRSRATEIEALRCELTEKTLQLDVLTQRCGALEHALAARTSELETLLAQREEALRQDSCARDALSGELADERARVESLERRGADLERQLGEQSERARSERSRADELERTLAARTSELEGALSTRTTELEGQLAQRDEDLRQRTEALDTVRGELDGERDRVESFERRCAEVERQLAQQNEQTRDERSRAEELERTLAARASELERVLSTRTSELEWQLAERDDELRERTTALDTMRGDLADKSWRCGEFDAQVRQLSERTQSIESRTGELETQLAQRDEELRQRATALDTVRGELGGERGRVESLEQRCADVERQLAQQNEQARGERSRAEELERTLVARTSELERALSTQTGELETQLAQRDEELRQRSTALDSVRGELADKTWRCGELDAQVRQQFERTQSLEARTGELETQLAQRDDELRQRTAALDAVRGELADKAWRCGELDAHVRQQSEQGQGLEQRVRELEQTLATRTSELEGQLAQRDEELRHRAAAAESLNDVLAEKNRELHVLDGRRAELEQATSARVGELDTSLAMRENELQQLRAEHARLTERCEALARTADASGSDLHDREREIADADARIDTLNRELEQRREEFRADGTSIDELVEGRICALFKRRSEQDSESLPPAYLEGLAQHDFDLALRGLLGDTAPLSTASMARLGERWRGEYQTWTKVPSRADVVYLWADGIHVRAGLAPEKSSLLVLVAGLVDGTKCVTAVESGQREDPQAWLAILRDLQARGMNVPRAIVADGALGLWPALDELGWNCARQTCWAYEIERIVAELPKRQQRLAGELLRDISNADTRSIAARMKDDFVKRYRKRRPLAGERLQGEWERLSSFYAFPADHWPHLRTTHVVESPFATMRLRTSVPKPCAPTANAEALLWKLLVVGERTFRKLNSPQLLPSVAAGALFVDGEPRDRSRARAA